MRGDTKIFNILPITRHFQRAVSPELKNLNPSFIYQNTPLNVLFKMLGCSSWKNLGFEHSEGDTTDFWRFALGGGTLLWGGTLPIFDDLPLRGDIIQQPGVKNLHRIQRIEFVSFFPFLILLLSCLSMMNLEPFKCEKTRTKISRRYAENPHDTAVFQG